MDVAIRSVNPALNPMRMVLGSVVSVNHLAVGGAEWRSVKRDLVAEDA